LDRAEESQEAAGGPRLLLLGDLALLISPATLADMSAIGSVARGRVKKDTPLGRITGDPAFATLQPAERLEVLRPAGHIQATGREAPDLYALADEFLRPRTLAFAVWVLARKNHPELKLEAISALVTEENAAEVYILLNDAAGMTGLVEKNSAAGTSG
jgi:hypothetical protein